MPHAARRETEPFALGILAHVAQDEPHGILNRGARVCGRRALGMVPRRATRGLECHFSSAHRNPPASG